MELACGKNHKNPYYRIALERENMAIGIHSKTKAFDIGSGAFLGSFFDTIEIRLTQGALGNKFPTILGELYRGSMAFSQLDMAREELMQIQLLLKQFKPSEIIWDKYDRSKRPPWGDNISPAITDLSNYFVTSEGKDLFAVLFEAIAYAQNEQSGLTIR